MKDLKDIGLAKYRMRRIAKITQKHPGYDDLLQELRLKLWELEERYDPERGVKWVTYASISMDRAIRDWLKRHNRKGFTHVDDSYGAWFEVKIHTKTVESLDYSSNPSVIAEHFDHKAMASRALRSVSERERAVVTYRLFDGLLFKEVGELMGCSKQRAEQLYQRALLTMRKGFAPATI